MSIAIQNAKVGMKARFTGRDTTFHNREREQKIGIIIADADSDPCGKNFGGGTCMWRVFGDTGWYVTSLSDLTEV